MKRKIILFFVMILCSLCVFGQNEQAKSVFYYNGNIITMTEDNNSKPIIFKTLLVKDGKIEAVGIKKSLVKNISNIEYVNLKGKTIVPGFIDAHSHLSSYAQTLAIAQLGNTISFEEIIKRMKDFLESQDLKEGQWLVGFGYDHNDLKEKHHPDKNVLDLISKDIPIVITHTSGHMGVLNSKALELCGINSKTQNPQGGIIERIKGTNEPSGYMEEAAFMATTKYVNPPKFDFESLVKKAETECFKYGITTTQDALMGQKEFALLMPLVEQNKLLIDVVGYVDLKNAKDLFDKYKKYHKNYINHFKIGGYKIFMDGSPQGRTAWLTEPYLPIQNDKEENYKGYPVYKDKEIKDFIKQSVFDNASLHSHCNGDAAADQFINTWKEVIKEENLNDCNRSTMIHTQVIRKDQFDSMAEIKMIPSMFPSHVWYWGDVHLKNLGQERGKNISALGYALNANLPFTFHQDTPVIPPNMLESLWCAVNRITKDGVLLSEEQKISSYEGLKAMTINGAYEIWEEDVKGSIEKGKIADFVILDKNPLKIDSLKIKDIKVLETVKNGKTVYKCN